MNPKMRQNYHEDCEAAINKQINMELYASYTYLSMVSKVSILNHSIAIITQLSCRHTISIETMLH